MQNFGLVGNFATLMRISIHISYLGFCMNEDVAGTFCQLHKVEKLQLCES